MAKKITIIESNASLPSVRPATTPEARDNQLIALAYKSVEKRLREGTATSQEICHFLKLGSAKEELELEKLRKENELLKAKTTAIESAAQLETVYKEAMAAFARYKGESSDETDLL